MTTIDSDGGDGYLHWSFQGSPVLFSSVRLDSLGGFVLAALLTVTVCAVERLLSHASERRWGPAWLVRSRGGNAAWRAGMYWVLAALRLAYMLIAMTLHAGLILVALTTLAIGQFLIELRTPPPREREQGYASLEAVEAPLYPLPRSEHHDAPFQSSKSKPEDIFIHPADSHLARADARLAYPQEPPAWDPDADVARSLLGGRPGPRRAPFQIGMDDGAESD